MTAQFWEVAEAERLDADEAQRPAARHWDALDGPDPSEYQ